MFRKLIPAGSDRRIARSPALVTDVETAMSRGNFPLAEAMLQSYRAQRGVTPEYLEALSWLARGDSDHAPVRQSRCHREGDREAGRCNPLPRGLWTPSRICRWPWAPPSKWRLRY